MARSEIDPVTPESKYKVPALEKGLDILEELARSSTPQSLTQLANNLGRSNNEIYRMVNYLEWRGYIRREANSNNYYLSLKLYELAHLHPPLQTLLDAATVPMEKLALQIRQSCHLGVLRRGRLAVLKQADSPEMISLSVQVGGRFPVVHTVSGRLLLAHLPPDQLQVFLDLDTDYRRLSDDEREAFHSRLDTIRNRGYEEADSETHVGIRDLAVLVGNPDVGLIAALAVPSLMFAKAAPVKEEILRAMFACSHQITALLGVENGIQDHLF